jgi:hypothetical protein
VAQGLQFRGNRSHRRGSLGVSDRFFDKTEPTKLVYSVNRSKTSINRIGFVGFENHFGSVFSNPEVMSFFQRKKTNRAFRAKNPEHKNYAQESGAKESKAFTKRKYRSKNSLCINKVDSVVLKRYENQLHGPGDHTKINGASCTLFFC